MPNIKSAIKRVRVTEKKTEANKMQKSAVRTAVKKAKTAIAASDPKKDEIVQSTQTVLDKAVAKGFLHKNTAARRKSRLAKASNAGK